MVGEHVGVLGGWPDISSLREGMEALYRDPSRPHLMCILCNKTITIKKQREKEQKKVSLRDGVRSLRLARGSRQLGSEELTSLSGDAYSDLLIPIGC